MDERNGECGMDAIGEDFLREPAGLCRKTNPVVLPVLIALLLSALLGCGQADEEDMDPASWTFVPKSMNGKVWACET